MSFFYYFDNLQAEKSELSKKYYTSDDIDIMFESFKNENESFLLFLKYIRCIEWYEWTDNNDDIGPKLMFQCQLPQKLLTKKQLNIRSYIVTNVKRDAIANGNLPQWIDCDLFDFSTISYETAAATENDNKKNEKQVRKAKSKYCEYHSQWIICNAIGGGSNQATKIACDPNNKDMKLFPYGGVAARVKTTVPWHMAQK